MNYPQLVSNLTEDQGIGIAIEGDSIEDSGLEFCQYYGQANQCEMYHGFRGHCQRKFDGNLWGSNDMGSPVFCTEHAFPQEQLGYEFVAMELVKRTINGVAHLGLVGSKDAALNHLNSFFGAK